VQSARLGTSLGPGVARTAQGHLARPPLGASTGRPRHARCSEKDQTRGGTRLRSLKTCLDPGSAGETAGTATRNPTSARREGESLPLGASLSVVRCRGGCEAIGDARSSSDHTRSPAWQQQGKTRICHARVAQLTTSRGRACTHQEMRPSPPRLLELLGPAMRLADRPYRASATAWRDALRRSRCTGWGMLLAISEIPPRLPRHDLIAVSATIRRDPTGRYFLNDLHRASGGLRRHQPAHFLSNKSTQRIIAELEGASRNSDTPLSPPSSP
jgi:hypothetical protein